MLFKGTVTGCSDFANRTTADYIYANLPVVIGLFPPEVMGEVEDVTMTHGFAFAEADSLLTATMGTQHATWHEFYHLLGSCTHALTLKASPDGRISILKRMAGDNSFYPSMNLAGNSLFLSRAEVNRQLARYSYAVLP